MNKKIWVIIIAVIIIIGGIYFYYTSTPTTEPTNTTSYGTDNDKNYQPLSTTNGNTDNQPSQGVLREFTVTGTPFSFSPNTLTVNKGDMVKITFKNANGFHNLTIDGYGISTPNIQAGEQSVIQFTANKSGSFQYYCSVDSHRDKGMVGTLVVNP